MNQDELGYVYLLHAKESSFYKLGITWRSSEIRLKELQPGCMYDLETEFSIQIENCEFIEAQLQKALERYRMRSEWYELSNLLVIAIMSYITIASGKDLSLVMESSIATETFELMNKEETNDLERTEVEDLSCVRETYELNSKGNPHNLEDENPLSLLAEQLMR